MLGYIGGKQFEEQPWKGVLLGLGIAFTVAFLIEAVRHRRARRQAPVGPEPEIDSDHGSAGP